MVEEKKEDSGVSQEEGEARVIKKDYTPVQRIHNIEGFLFYGILVVTFLRINQLYTKYPAISFSASIASLITVFFTSFYLAEIMIMVITDATNTGAKFIKNHKVGLIKIGSIIGLILGYYVLGFGMEALATTVVALAIFSIFTGTWNPFKKKK